MVAHMGCNLLILKVVRKGGLEPPRYCYRQPLKLVRLPIPPLPRNEGAGLNPPRLSRPSDLKVRRYFFSGAGAGGAGAGLAGAGLVSRLCAGVAGVD